MSQMQLLASRRPDSLPVVQPQQQQPQQQQQRGTRRRAGSSSREGGDRAEDSGIGSATGDMTPCRRARLSLELNAAATATEKKEAQHDAWEPQQNATFGEDSKSDNNIGISKSNNNNFLFAPSPAADFSGGNQFAIDGYGNGTAATGRTSSTFSSSSSIINKLPLLTNELLKAAEAEEEPEDNGFHTLQQQQQKHHRQLQQDPNFRWAIMMSAAAATSAAGKGEENKKSIGPSSAHQQQRRCMAMALPPPEEPVLENSRLLGSSATPSTTIIPPPTSSSPIPSAPIPSSKISSAKISYSSSSSKSTTFSSSSSNSSSSSSPRAALLSGSLSCANLARIASGPALASSACCAGSTSDGMPIFSGSCSSSALDQLLQSTEPTQLFDHLFLGSQKDALDVDLLQRRGISRVINLSENCPRAACLPDDARHFLRIPVNDTYSAKLLPHFEAAFHFIEDARKAGERVLLHCLAGISRSPTLAIAYVMRSRGMTNDEAYNFVKSRRPGISPNFNFLGQLWEYERQLRQQHVLPPLPPPASSSFAEKQEEVNAQVEDAATIADISSPPTSLASTFSSIPSSSPPIVVANANSSNGKNKRPKLMMSVEDNNNSSGNMMKAESEQPTATKQQQDQQQQEKPTRPVVRPRQLLGAPNQRLSCPPFLTTELPSPNKSNSNNIPSPSTEFSRLDISLANPCFGLSPVPGPTSMPSRARCQALAPRRKLSPLFSAASMLENPVFGKTLSDGGDWRERLAKSGTPSVESTASSSGVSSASFCSSSAESFCSSLNDSFSSLADENGPAAAFGAAAGNVPFPGPSAAGSQFLSETGGPSTRNCLADSDGDELVRFGPPPQVRGGYSAFVRQDRDNTAEDDGTFHAEKRKNGNDGNDDKEDDKVLQACMRAPLPSLERELMMLNSADPFTGMEEFKGIGEEEMDKQHREMQKQQNEMHMQQKEMQKQMRMRMEQVRMKQKVLAEAKKCLGSTRHCMLAKLDLRPNPPPQHAQKRHFHALLNRCYLPSQRHPQQLVQQQSQQPQQDQPQQPQVHWRGQQQQPSHVQGLMASSSSTSSSSSLSSSRPRLAKSHCIDRLLAFGRKKNLHPGISGAGAHLFRQSLPTIGDDRGREEEEEEEEEEHKGKEEEHKGKEEVEKESKDDDDDVVGEKGGEEQQLQVNSLFPAAAASGNQQQQKLEPTAPLYLDPDRASISSASSLEIAVQ